MKQVSPCTEDKALEGTAKCRRCWQAISTWVPLGELVLLFDLDSDREIQFFSLLFRV